MVIQAEIYWDMVYLPCSSSPHPLTSPPAAPWTLHPLATSPYRLLPFQTHTVKTDYNKQMLCSSIKLLDQRRTLSVVHICITTIAVVSQILPKIWSLGKIGFSESQDFFGCSLYEVFSLIGCSVYEFLSLIGSSLYEVLPWLVVLCLWFYPWLAVPCTRSCPWLTVLCLRDVLSVIGS